VSDIAIEMIFKALSDPTRIRLIRLLSAGEKCVCKLFQPLNLPQSKVSRHLAYLRKVGLVKNKKHGLWQYYSLNVKLIKKLSLDKTLNLRIQKEAGNKDCPGGGINVRKNH
jgi:DNA-binding transcriptional ArsR family regulator